MPLFRRIGLNSRKSLLNDPDSRQAIAQKFAAKAVWFNGLADAVRVNRPLLPAQK